MFGMRVVDLQNRKLAQAPERQKPPSQPSLLQRQGADTINIQFPFGAPALYPFWNGLREGTQLWVTVLSEKAGATLG